MSETKQYQAVARYGYERIERIDCETPSPEIHVFQTMRRLSTGEERFSVVWTNGHTGNNVALKRWVDDEVAAGAFRRFLWRDANRATRKRRHAT